MNCTEYSQMTKNRHNAKCGMMNQYILNTKGSLKQKGTYSN